MYLKHKILLLIALFGTIPWIYIKYGNIHIPEYFEALISGIAIVSAATLISWASETAEVDVQEALH